MNTSALSQIYRSSVQQGLTADTDTLTFNNQTLTMTQAERLLENQRVIDAVALGIRDARMATLQNTGLPADLFLLGVLAPIMAARLSTVFPELDPEDFIAKVKV